MIRRWEDDIPDFSLGKIDHPETRLHLCVVDYLNGDMRHGKNVTHGQAPFPELFFTAPTGEKKDESEAYWAKRKGYMPGTPDLLFWWKETNWQGHDVRAGAIELKSKDGYPSPAQKEWMRRFMTLGGKYALCRKVVEVRDAIISWGLECKNALCIEPKISQAEAMALAWESMKP